MRNAYLAALYTLAKENRHVLALVADNGAIVYDKFRQDFPKQFVNFGIAEANMVSVAAGLASSGKIPFAYTIANFLTMRAYEQVRNDVCLQKQNVKLVGIGGGFVYSTLGPTHHATEDIAIMKVLPNMTILSPASPKEAYQSTFAAAAINGPVYIRLGTTKEAELYSDEYHFELGKGIKLLNGEDLTLVATGSIVKDVLEAAKELKQEGISARVINIHTIKPMDQDVLIEAARETEVIITVEEHNIIGGLGSAVSELLLESGGSNIFFDRVGLKDCFCKDYGSHSDLKKANGLSIGDIKERAIGLYEKKLSKRKMN